MPVNRKKLVDAIYLSIKQGITQMILFGSSKAETSLFETYMEQKIKQIEGSGDFPQMVLHPAIRGKFETCWLIIEAVYRTLEVNQ
ncbi:MAG: hypothetical protein ACTSPK_00080 [Candidatus Heimdallarchaeota archaeon]